MIIKLVALLLVTATVVWSQESQALIDAGIEIGSRLRPGFGVRGFNSGFQRPFGLNPFNRPFGFPQRPFFPGRGVIGFGGRGFGRGGFGRGGFGRGGFGRGGFGRGGFGRGRIPFRG